MKTNEILMLIFMLFLAIGFPMVASAAVENDAYTYNKLYSAYTSGFYPGVIAQADSFLQEYPKSLYADEAILYKAVSCFQLGRYSDAELVLNELLLFSEVPITQGVAVDALYWKGRCLFLQENYKEAYNAFYDSATRAVKTDESYNYPLYNDILYYAARTAYNLGNNEDAESILEYLVACPSVAALRNDRFYPVVLMLFSIYEELGHNSRTVNLYKQLDIESFPPAIGAPVKMTAADAYSNLAADEETYFKNAIDIYINLLSCDNETISVIALQKAYILSSRFASLPDFPSDYSGSKIVEKASSIFGSDSPLLTEFHVRLGIAAFESRDYQKALVCFDDAEKQKDIQFDSLIALYRAAISYELQMAENESGGSTLIDTGPIDIIKNSLSEDNQYYPWTLIAAVEYSMMHGDTISAAGYFEKYIALMNDDTKATHDSDGQIPWNELYLSGRRWYAAALFKNGSYEEIVKFFNNDLLIVNENSSLTGGESLQTNTVQNGLQQLDKDSAIIYAQSLMLTGETEKAMGVFESLEKLNANDSEFISLVRLNYSKAAILSGQNTLAGNLLKDITAASDDMPSSGREKAAEKVYTAGLAAFNVGNWERSYALLSSFADIYSKDNFASEWISWALYYSAFSQYRMGNLENAFDEFAVFIKQYQNHSMYWNSLMTSARCAIQMYQLSERPELRTSAAWLSKAESLSRLAIDNAGNQIQKGESSLLAANVASNLKKYDEAIALIKPFTGLNTSLGMECQYQLAEILAEQGSINQADTAFGDFLTRFPGTSLAEDALFRRGEIRFDNSEWERAAAYFTKYRRSYADGMHSDSALFMNAICLSNSKQPDQAILLFQELIRAYPNSTYIYTALVNLASLHRQKGEYGSAAEALAMLLTRYGKQADQTDIDKMSAEIDLLLTGLEEQAAVELAAFNANGGSSTVEGRTIGIRLAKLYMASPSKRNEAEELLLKLLPEMRADAEKERDGIAAASKMLGSFYREENEYLKAAKYYLDAAEYFSGTDSESAAQSLYGAVDAFDYALLFADANGAYTLLKSSYPSSIWTKRAAVIIEGEN